MGLGGTEIELKRAHVLDRPNRAMLNTNAGLILDPAKAVGALSKLGSWPRLTSPRGSLQHRKDRPPRRVGDTVVNSRRQLNATKPVMLHGTSLQTSPAAAAPRVTLRLRHSSV